jgi:tetratricopeptide (TPR) repeat protein
MIPRTIVVAAVGWLWLVPATSHARATHEHGGGGLGSVDFPVSCSDGTRAAFNTAVAMLHNFWYPQSLNAFNEIIKNDPACAMAYWGVAMAERTNPLVGAAPAALIKRGAEAIEKARSFPVKTERERDFIAAMEVYYAGWDKLDHATRVLAYEKKMEEMAKRHPKDDEVAIFHALALNEGIAVSAADKTYSRHIRAAEICDAVLARNPHHPGALHYQIHSYDYPALAARGVAAANRYASVATEAPHALHMPSHVYSMLGMWKESIDSNRAALGVAKAYVHAMDFSAYAHLQMGQDRQAERLVKEGYAVQGAAAGTPSRSPTGGVLPVYTAYAALPARFAIERGAWAEAAALELRPTAPPADAITHFARAMGYARLGNGVKAREDIDKLKAIGDELASAKQDYWSEQVDIQRKAALAWVAQAEGKREEALSSMRSAADMEDASEKSVAMENRLWPMRELLAELLLEQGQPRFALKEFEASLKDSRNRLRGFAGAARAAEMLGDRKTAASYHEKVMAQTKEADSDRQEIRRAKAFLSGPFVSGGAAAEK